MTSRTRHILILTGLALIGAIGVYGAAWFFLERSADTIREYDAARMEAMVQEQELRQIESLYADSAKDRETLRAFVIGKDGVFEFLELIEGVSREQGLSPSTRSVQVEKSEGGDRFEVLSLTLEVTGAYGDIKALLPIIESLPYQVEVRSVSLEQSVRNDEQGGWRGVIVLRVSKEKGS